MSSGSKCTHALDRRYLLYRVGSEAGEDVGDQSNILFTSFRDDGSRLTHRRAAVRGEEEGGRAPSTAASTLTNSSMTAEGFYAASSLLSRAMGITGTTLLEPDSYTRMPTYTCCRSSSIFLFSFYLLLVKLHHVHTSHSLPRVT